MRAPSATATAMLATLACVSCAPEGRAPEMLPGHSRPVLEHDWLHPDELEFEDSGFRAVDPGSARLTTPSGARAYVIADPADPLVTIVAAVPLGSHFEEDGEIGAAQAVSRGLDGTLRERLGPGLVASTAVSQERDVTVLSVEVMAEDWHAALTAVVGTVREPAPGASGGSAGRVGGRGGGGGRARAVAELTTLVARHPIAPPDPEVRVRADAVQALGRRALRPAAVVFGVGGGVTRDEVEAALVELTAGWAADPGTGPVAAARPPTAAAARTQPQPLHTIDRPGFMSWTALGHAMPAISPEDEAAVAVLEEVVNIRLNIATREIRGLTNRAMLVLPKATDGAGVLHVWTGSRAESVGPLIRYSVAELTRIRTAAGAPSREELDQAKGGLALGRWQESLDGARRTAATYAVETVRRGSLDYLIAWPAAVLAVTAEEVTAAAVEYIDPGAMTAVVVGQIDDVRAARHPRWPVALDEVPSQLRPMGRVSGQQYEEE
ncbi:MAG: hypothetical protein OXE96_03015 [Gemmatimonadetes bacterium]|nr:hypothetical protein [Gemmatimonadota bacterium]